MRARQYTLADLMAFNIICQPAAFIRRSVLEEAGYLDPAYQLLMDNLLWMCMARKAPIVYTPQTWAAARYHDQAKNRTRGAAYGQEARRLIADLRSRPEFSELIQADEKHILAGVERFDGFYLTDAGQPCEALHSYWRAFRLYPKMAVQDWKHILLTILSLLGLDKARLWYDRLRTRCLHLE
jgi:hypothetical protein